MLPMPQSFPQRSARCVILHHWQNVQAELWFLSTILCSILVDCAAEPLHLRQQATYLYFKDPLALFRDSDSSTSP